ncbi:MAG TPA: ATP synthase F1 subunit gamma [Phycisphaerae bacterium]|nr:ATP synthase F1 subunit gamma [Phycisphaerae bacterium]HNU45042.1 ATP synthase F1 subunit gamma [Phycisphaerae bacterium]
MAKPRAIVKRRKTVRNIRKITRTMQLIATARFQAAFNRAMATKPYTRELAALVRALAQAAGDVQHPLMRTPETVRRCDLLIITSNRGLCGGYNTGILRCALAELEKLEREQVAVDVRMAGKKGAGYFRFLRRPLAESITHVGDPPRFEQVEPIANALMERFQKDETQAAYVAYMQFISAGQQRPVVMPLLPLAQEAETAEAPAEPAATRVTLQYEFSPEPRELLDELLPATVRTRLFQCFTDALVSEHTARMVAMKAATDAAGDMIRSLTQQYNRARQTQITMELLDIVGGANALA